MVNERSDEEKEAHWETKLGVRGKGSQGPESDRKKNNQKTQLHFLVNFVLLTVCLEPSVQLRMPAR